jgi:periplasmic protein TonB
MKTIAFALTFMLLALSPVEVPGKAQNSRRPRPRPPARVSGIEEIDVGSPEERARIAEECAAPRRPKPVVEAGMRGNALRCGKAISKPQPAYPAAAKAERVSGTVTVDVVLDEKGRVVWAEAADGHELLRGAAVKAACQSRFSPVKISGRAVKAGGALSYNFVLQ